MIRILLDKIYLLCGYLSGTFLVAILVAIFAQVVGRWLPFAVDMVEISGFCLAATTFLGLAYSLGHGAHIRINLLIRHFSSPVRKLVELWCCTVGAVAAGYLAYNVVVFNIQTFMLGNKTLGLVVFGIWIPQLGFSIGTVVLTIAFVDEFVRVLHGRVPRYEENATPELGEMGPLSEGGGRPAASPAAGSN
ncbi:MAG: TRAP transporter small permease [Proteobacteria bacterium]|nr:TRAP transporter small permease [Pseudomonadota bacterium]